MRTSKPYSKIAPKIFQSLMAFQESIDASGVEPALLQLVALRASQINGCALCLKMHAEEARRLGVAAAKVDTVAGWRDDPAFTPQERAALAWAETLTRVADNGADPDEPYRALAAHFDEAQIVGLTMEIGVINVWNRLNVGLANPPMR